MSLRHARGRLGVAPLVVLVAALAGCASTPRAPVIDRQGSTAPTAPVPAATPARPAVAAARPAPTDPRPLTYTVKRGDTLYGIALDHGLEYKELAEWNGLANPNLIRIDQVLRLRAPDFGAVPAQAAPATAAAPAAPRTGPDVVKTEPRAQKLPYTEENAALLAKAEPAARPAAAPAPAPAPAPSPAPAAKPAATPAPAPAAQAPAQSGGDADDEDKVDWAWPLAGRVIAGFSEPANKGLDIAGKAGEPVFATAPGRVVYSGTGLRGYGRLVIIKHNKTFLSAYAHNSAILVKEGQNVARGQKIAEVGSTDAESPRLHFEIRRFGKPVDPARYLPAR
jgi:lipoprotein NlpD